MSDASPLLHEPWSRLTTQREAGKFGIWIFLGSEVVFFGALFLGYSVCRYQNPAAFIAAARETNIWYGTANTFVLLTSSLTMAMAAQASDARVGLRRVILWSLALTALLGVAFLVIKGFEYEEDIDKGLVPSASFKLALPAAQIFFAFYWTTTAVHAVHLSIGIALVVRLWLVGLRRKAPLDGNPQLQVTALYWHLVDLVWIFLYPILYLPGRAQ